jgi:hypothetical protein
MALKNKTHDIDKAATIQRAPQQIALNSNEHERSLNPVAALRRATSPHPSALRPADILTLQRTIGNRAVQRMLSNQPHATSPQTSIPAHALQLKTEEEEDLLQRKFETIQRKENKTGLPDELKVGIENLSSPARPNLTGMPDGLKSGIESLSGISMDHVKIHYNSSRPAQLNALAYTQGSHIHVAPGQEQHLPHEAWHVVQQRQGRVKPTLQAKDIPINDDAGLENEADVMSAKAVANAQGNEIYLSAGQKNRPHRETWNVVQQCRMSATLGTVIQLAGELVAVGSVQETSEDVNHYVALFQAAEDAKARRALFRRLALELHPDKNPGKGVAFAAMQQAYRIAETPVEPTKTLAIEGPLPQIPPGVSASAQIQEEFSQVLYIRKTRRIEDEIQFVISDRVKYYMNGEQALKTELEKNYWHAAFTVLEGLPVQEYDSFKSSGLVISARSTELAGWGKVDMGLPTKNVPKASYPANFPPRAAGSAHGKTLSTTAQVSGKLKEVRSRVKGEVPDVSTGGKVRQDGFLMMVFEEGQDPEPYQPKAPYAEAQSIPYGEAQIHYKPSDILGVYLERDTADAIREAFALRRKLKSLVGKDLPLVEYKKGKITIHETTAIFLMKLKQENPEMWRTVRAALMGPFIEGN